MVSDGIGLATMRPGAADSSSHSSTVKDVSDGAVAVRSEAAQNTQNRTNLQWPSPTLTLLGYSGRDATWKHRRRAGSVQHLPRPPSLAAPRPRDNNNNKPSPRPLSTSGSGPSGWTTADRDRRHAPLKRAREQQRCLSSNSVCKAVRSQLVHWVSRCLTTDTDAAFPRTPTSRLASHHHFVVSEIV